MGESDERLFTVYANHYLRESPRDFFKIYDAIDRYHPFLVNLKNLRLVTEAIVSMALDEVPNGQLYDDAVLTKAKEAVYGCDDGFCESECSVRRFREDKLGRAAFEGPCQLRCIECDQRDFVRMLKEIIDGNSYNEIQGLGDFIEAGRDVEKKTTIGEVEWEITPAPSRSARTLEDAFPKPQRFGGYNVWDCLSIEEGKSKPGFRHCLSALVAYSLSTFLDEDESNRQSLKRCRMCHSFFIAKDMKREICYYSDCEKDRERAQKKDYMRKKRDPDSTEYDERYKTREFGKKQTS